MNLCANWFGSLSRGHVTVECTAYKGGVIVRAWQLKIMKLMLIIEECLFSFG